MSSATDRGERHRRVRYRTPLDPAGSAAESWGRSVTFLRRYLQPHAGGIVLCLLLVSLEACSVYLMAYYGRVVVDQVLVVPVGKAGAAAASGPARIAARDLRPEARGRPRHGRVGETQMAAEATLRPPNAMGRLLGMFLLYAGTLLLLNGASRLSQRMRITMDRSITKRIREDVHAKILALSRGYHQSHTPGRLMARILSDVNIVQHQLVIVVLHAGSHVVMFVVGAALLFLLDWRVALIALTAMPPYVWLYRRAGRKMRSINRELRHTNSSFYSYAAQKLDAVRAVFAYGREKHEQLSFHRLGACFFRDALAGERCSAELGRSVTILTSAATTLVFLFCTRSVLAGRMTLGEMLYLYGVSATLFQPVLVLTHISMAATNLLVIIDRLTQIFDEPVTVSESAHAVPLPAALSSGIRLNHVHFRYGAESDPVLRDISLTIPAGRWTCLMGASGSGKTTLLHLLVRLADPTSGDITVGGLPLRMISLASLRATMSLVPQEAEIFSGTVRDNITYGDNMAEPARIMAAARAAECHDFIMDLPVKYETTLGEKGASLSGGQRQRIALARALLTEPQVLLLDDCTSALDADTERRIQETMSRLLAGRTAVIVTQRVSMAMRCSQICVLSGGIISEKGTHTELVARGGFYARLHAQQTE